MVPSHSDQASRVRVLECTSPTVGGERYGTVTAFQECCQHIGKSTKSGAAAPVVFIRPIRSLGLSPQVSVPI
jgi:hypothetical protein